MKKEEVKATSYTLYTKSGDWLGQVVLTNDGLFASVTDYGNCSYAWRAYGDKYFREFIIGLNIDYFAGKMYSGVAYMGFGKTYEKACHRFAEKILPALQDVLKAEITEETKD